MKNCKGSRTTKIYTPLSPKLAVRVKLRACWASRKSVFCHMITLPATPTPRERGQVIREWRLIGRSIAYLPLNCQLGAERSIGEGPSRRSFWRELRPGRNNNQVVSLERIDGPTRPWSERRGRGGVGVRLPLLKRPVRAAPVMTLSR